MAKVPVPDILGPKVQLCWQQGPLMHRCDRKRGHDGPHTWEMAAEVKALKGLPTVYAPAATVAATVRKMRGRVCAWTEDEDGNWDTDCGDKFVFTESGPTDNGMRFCCYCGKPLKEVNHD